MHEKILTLSGKIPVMLLGAPGIGKTAVVTEFAEKLGADLVDIRLSAETPSSFEGKDFILPETKTLQKARAWWLQRIDKNKAENRPTVLFFDEYTNAPDALQQLAYSPFNERKLHGESFDYALQNGESGLYVFGAGNRVEDETGAREIVHASKTRVFTVDFKVTTKEWLEWAEANGIHEKVRSFLLANPDALLEKPSSGTACPREWANLSKALQEGIPYRMAAHGTVRGAHEKKFCAFYKNSELCPTIADIVNGTAKEPDAVHLSAFTSVLAYALQEDENLTEHFPIVFDWIAEKSPACEIMFTKYAVGALKARLLKDKLCMEKLKAAMQKAGIR